MGTEGRHLVPAGTVQVELKIVNSRFITTAGPAFSVEEARAFIQEQKETFRDATHNVPVYIIGHGATVIKHCSDDREPSGTAGKPAMAVLEGSRIGDIVVVITRYFGGTKLGTGGLVRAYSDSMRTVLEEVPLAVKELCHTCALHVPYNLYEQVKRLLVNSQAKLLEEVFGVDTVINFQIAVSMLAPFQEQLSELSRGSLTPEIIRENHFALIPLPEKS